MSVNSIQSNEINNNYSMPVKTNHQQAFKANEKNESKDTFVKKKKDSVLYKYRGFLGCLAGIGVGEFIWSKKLGSIFENMKGMTKFKYNAISLVFTCLTCMLGGTAAREGFRKN